MSERNHKAGCVVAILTALLMIAVPASTHFYKQNMIRQVYLEKGIYEVEDTLLHEYYASNLTVCPHEFYTKSVTALH